jgi:hypothetical protein
MNEIEFLKQQLIAKDEMISFLKAQILSLQSKPQIIEVVKEQKEEYFNLDEYLNKTCKDAINFEDLFDINEPYMYNCKMNKWIQIGGYEEDIYMVFKYIEVGYYPKTNEFFSDMFCSVFNKIHHHKKPIFCSDVKRSNYYYKTNDKWEVIEEKKLLKLIYNRIMTLCTLAFMNTKEFSKKYPDEFFKYYNKDKNWFYRNSGELSLVACYNSELDNFTSICHSKLTKISSRKEAKHIESNVHDWSEFKDEGKKYDTESDEE